VKRGLQCGMWRKCHRRRKLQLALMLAASRRHRVSVSGNGGWREAALWPALMLAGVIEEN